MSNLKAKKTTIIVCVAVLVLAIAFGAAYKSVQAKKTAELEKQIALEEERLKAEEEEKLRIQEEERKKAEEEARLKAEEEKIKAEEEKKKAEEEAKKDSPQSMVASEESAKENSDTTASILESNLPMKKRIEKYLGKDIKKFGFIYYDLATNEKISINKNKVFTAASTYKVGLNMVAYEDVRKGVLDINKGIKYNPDTDYEGGTGILQQQVNTTLAKPVPLQKLLDLSITHSDNIATLMASRVLGGTSTVRKRMNSMVGLSCVTSSNKTTPEIQFRLLKKLYDNRQDSYYAHLINVMKKTVFHDRLDKYLPHNKVAHKIGNYGAAVNDIGIVFTDKPYIIVAYSEGIDNAAEKIAKISKMVYTEQLRK
ncbi:serine hydrolase [Clostridium polynesiense]|uniref:serine hydrolase n=1 Tax=Clostridium polynesiense TaxID=1325933 RepID=UPI000693AD1E|nr:serine hydrolase [Clostridium polynesiense]